MPDPATFVLFLGGALILNITPGPDMAFTLATSARGGVRAGIAAALGVGVGSLAWAVLTAAGLAALLGASEHAFTVIRIAGGAYLIYLAIRTIRHRHDLPHTEGAPTVLTAFRSGAMTNLFNPKVGLFFLAFLPTFTTPDGGPIWMQTLILGAIFSFTGAGVLVLVALGAGAMRDRLAQSRKLRIALDMTAATVFGGLGLHLLFARDY